MKIYTSKIHNNRVFDKNIIMNKINNGKNENNFYSYFLKRKRIEKGMKLQDVSSGICSISYLSRIENNQTLPDDGNLKLLFERLDLNYDDVKRKREANIYEELLKKELSKKTESIKKEISDIITTNAYATIELDLLVLYSSIIDRNYEEARFILSRLEVNLELFTNQEMIFYIYLFCRYLFETNQNKRAYAQVKVLNSINLNDQFMNAIICDLSIDIAFLMGEYEQVIKFYYMLSQNENGYLFNKKIAMHKLQTLVADSKFNLKENIEEFINIKKTLEDDNINNVKYNYYISLAYFKNGHYQKSLELLRDYLDDAKTLALYAHLVKKIGNSNDIAIFKNKYKEKKFSKYEYIYENFCEYVSLYMRGESSIHLYSYIKQKLLSNGSLFFDFIINDISKKEFIEVGMKTSKYKETLRYINDESE